MARHEPIGFLEGELMLSRSFIFVLGLVAACQGSDDLSYTPQGSTSGTPPQPYTGDPNSQNATANSSNLGTGTPATTQSNSSTNSGESIAYPNMTFCGGGTLHSIDANPITVATGQDISEAKVISRTTKFNSSDSNVDKEVSKLAGTSTTYTRTAKQLLASINAPIYLMFARESLASDGKKLTFSAPLPLLVVPMDPSRYDGLKSKPASFPNIRVRDAQNDAFVVNATVHEEGREGSTIRIVITYDIPTDTDGKLYDKFGLPRTSVYHINTATKRVMKLVTDTFYFNKQKGKRSMQIDQSLSTYTANGQTQNYATCP